ncbi:MAG: cob(I)yrinic acid a,c-diamide adenosyltransferase [Rhodospirillales bacterium]|nr:cob(I)yrinic acid a,c-diamide adenosyltransferase [Rhodospirillales bacterium]
MVRIDRVVTRGGDAGETSLGDGARVGKETARIEAIGAVDEANAALGVLRCLVSDDATMQATLSRLQNDLFDVGADLAVPGEAGERLRLTEAPVMRLEAEIAAMNAGLAPLSSFVLPGGTPAAAQAHVARTLLRRAERRVAALRADGVNPALLRLLNRASDHLFVLSRLLNARASGDVLWVPGANR